MDKKQIIKKRLVFNLQEKVSRKDFVAVANHLKSIPDHEERRKLAQHHAGLFKAANSNFDHKRFYAAANVHEEAEVPKYKVGDTIVCKGTQAVGKVKKVHPATKGEHEYTIHLHNVGDTKRKESHLGLNEEKIEELSKKTLGNYIKKAAFSTRKSAWASGKASAKSKISNKDNKVRIANNKISQKRENGIATAVRKLTKEENLQELSKTKLGQYIKKAVGDVDKSVAAGAYAMGKSVMSADGKSEKHHKLASKRIKGVNTAVKKLTREEALDELSKSTLGSYVKKAKDSLHVQAWNHGNKLASGGSDEDIIRHSDTADKRNKGINRAVDKILKK